MDEKEYRRKLKEWDEKKLDDRVTRWKQINPATYVTPLPELVWEYLSEADDLYITGHFMSAILFCAGIAELVLGDQVASRMKMTGKEIERFELERLIILGRRLGVLNEVETNGIHELRKLRNNIIHGNTGKLAKLAKTTYQGSGLSDYHVAGFYLTNFGREIERDSLEYLRLIRELSVRFYGEKS